MVDLEVAGGGWAGELMVNLLLFIKVLVSKGVRLQSFSSQSFWEGPVIYVRESFNWNQQSLKQQLIVAFLCEC